MKAHPLFWIAAGAMGGMFTTIAIFAFIGKCAV